MAKLRLSYDLNNGPYWISDGKDDRPRPTSPDAKIINMGSNTYPILSVTSGYLMRMQGKFTHTSGDARILYCRLSLHGSVGGEALRVFTNVNANLDTARGAHISLNFVATAGGSECSGLGVAAAFTLHIPNVASWAPTGTYGPVSSEIYSDGTNSDPAGMTTLAFYHAFLSGNTTGDNDVDSDAVLLNIEGPFTATKGGSNMLAETGDEPTWDNVTMYIKIKVKGTIMYLLAVPTIASD